MDDDVKRLLSKARRDRPEPESPQRDTRYVFGGEAMNVDRPPDRQRNKRIVRRSISTFNAILLLFGLGIGIVLYINNAIAVDHLAAEIGRQQAVIDSVVNVNAGLRAEVNRKSSWEKIGKTATDDLGLAFPTEQPQELTVDADALERAKNQ